MYDLIVSYEELWKPVVTLIPELGIDSWVFFFFSLLFYFSLSYFCQDLSKRPDPN